MMYVGCSFHDRRMIGILWVEQEVVIGRSQVRGLSHGQ